MGWEHKRLFESYLQHHWSGAQGGLDLFRRAASSQLDRGARRELARLADEVAEDRDALADMIRALDITPGTLGPLLAALGERLGRLKPNGLLVRRSPLSDVLELETLTIAVDGKKRGWLSLRHVAGAEARLPVPRLDELIRRSEDQRQTLEMLRIAATDRLAPTGSDTDLADAP